MAPAESAFPVKKLISLTASLAERIKEFRFQRRIETDNEAIRQLLELGLDASKREDWPV